MEAYKRQKFLQAFLGALGASQIQWTDYDNKSVSGTVIYDPTDPEERQDFVWHMEEGKTPDEAAIILLKHLKYNSLLNGDKLVAPVEEISVPDMDEETKERAFEELFTISVAMVDEGEETDSFYIHD